MSDDKEFKVLRLISPPKDANKKDEIESKVAMLEHIIELVKSGKVLTVGAVLRTSEGTAATMVSRPCDEIQMIGLFEMAKVTMVGMMQVTSVKKS